MGRSLTVVLIVMVILQAASVGPSLAVVVDFDDRPEHSVLSGDSYQGVVWELGNSGYQGNQGYWVTTRTGYSSSAPSVVTNGWGCTLLGIQFSGPVRVVGAYFAAQGGPAAWTTGVRVRGYRTGLEVAVTDWFTDIDLQPDWFAINLDNVDRIVVESIPVLDGGGAYAMDDFTYEPVPEPSSILTLLFGIAGAGGFIRRRARVPLLQHKGRQ